jgi:hypothetical protein
MKTAKAESSRIRLVRSLSRQVLDAPSPPSHRESLARLKIDSAQILHDFGETAGRERHGTGRIFRKAAKFTASMAFFTISA